MDKGLAIAVMVGGQDYIRYLTGVLAARRSLKPRIQRVLTQWNPGFRTSGRHPALGLEA
jgi:hypothetical protein